MKTRLFSRSTILTATAPSTKAKARVPVMRHIDSQAYVKVSQEEIEVAIEFTKEALKAIYRTRPCLLGCAG